jgi:hypothetical protein
VSDIDPGHEGPSGEADRAPDAPPEMGAEDLSPEDLALDADTACDLFSEHGGEIVILDDGRVVFMNASEHLVELAHAIDPDNAEITERMQVIERVRADREAAADAGDDRTAPEAG